MREIKIDDIEQDNVVFELELFNAVDSDLYDVRILESDKDSSLEKLKEHLKKFESIYETASRQLIGQLASLAATDKNNSNHFKVLVAVYTNNNKLYKDESVNPITYINQICAVQKRIVTERGMIPVIHVLLGSNLTSVTNSQWPRYRLIMDSSIWNTCIWINEDGAFSDTFASVFKKIYENWRMGLYCIGSATEYVEFNSRLVQQSHIIEDGNHGNYISPFLFHSETVAKINLAHAESNPDTLVFSDKGIRRRWRFLLVDDQANSYVSSCKKEHCSLNEPKLTKLDILVQRLSSLRKEDGTPIVINTEGQNINDSDIDIECVTSVSELVNKLWRPDSKRYDLLLMDYLLGERKSPKKNPRKMEREYSYEFLCLLKFLRNNVLKNNSSIDTFRLALGKDEIVKNYIVENDGRFFLCGIELPENLDDMRKSILKGIGPHGRLYIMYTSSYVNAVQERLNALAISRAEKYWFIGKGACPVNTPNLFLLNLYKLMQSRVRTFWPLEGYPSLDSFWGALFPGSNLRFECKLHFHDVLKLKESFDKVKDDDSSSLLAKSLFDTTRYNPEFWERMQHLCYLICYGTAQQWPEMWLEYNAVRSKLEESAANNLKKYIIEESRKSGIVNSIIG